MWHLPLKDGAVSKGGVFGYLPGIHGRTDSRRTRRESRCVHARVGIVWLLSPLGEPLFRIQASDGVSRLTNAAYGNADRKTLFICDSYNARILAAELPVAGSTLFSHL